MQIFLGLTVAVWHWDGKEEKARARTLVITCTEEKKPKEKFSFSNGGITEYSRVEYATFKVTDTGQNSASMMQKKGTGTF